MRLFLPTSLRRRDNDAHVAPSDGGRGECPRLGGRNRGPAGAPRGQRAVNPRLPLAARPATGPRGPRASLPSPRPPCSIRGASGPWARQC